MAFCKQCGTKLEDGAKSCPACGATQEETGTRQGPSDHMDFSETISKLTDTADTTASFDARDIEDNKVMSILAYIGPLFLIPLFAASKSKFARFHTNQGLVLFILDVLLSVATAVLGLLPVVGWVAGTLSGLIVLALMIFGIYNAATGRARELPLIGNIILIK